MHPFIIWTEPRSVGTALSNALKLVSDLPVMWDDPFVDDERPGLLVDAYRAWRRGSERPLDRTLAGRIVFKHCPANFGDGFNQSLAKAAERHGYRHIHLVRLSTFARLASRGVAEQLDAWTRPETRSKSADRDALAPFNVSDLVRQCRLGEDRWIGVERHLSAVLTVTSEEITDKSPERRRASLRRIIGFLELPMDAISTLDRVLTEIGENTEGMWSRVPNIDQLSRALAER